MPPHPQHTVLVVEDEHAIRQLLHTTLSAEGYLVHEAASAEAALVETGKRRIDVFLVDIGLPGADGLQLIRQLRRSINKPIIVLSARAQECEKVVALDAGADDYLVKPFGVGELHARLRAVLRNSVKTLESGQVQIRFGDVEVNLTSLTVMRAGVSVRLTATQWRLLTALSRNANRIVTSQQLLREVWGPGQTEQAHYLRIYVRQLRQRLEPEPTLPRYLITETGLGYRLLIDS